MSAVTRWVVPELALAQAAPQVCVEEVALEQVEPPSLEELQAIRDQARQAGYEEGLASGLASGHVEGLAKGLAQGQAEMRRLTAQIEGILDNFTRPLARLESEVAAALGSGCKVETTKDRGGLSRAEG